MTLLALTGTPGTGKTTIAQVLAREGWTVVHLADAAEDAGLLTEEDPDRPGTRVVDVDAVATHLEPRLERARGDALDIVAEAHWAHDLPGLDHVCVLRTRPTTLEGRLTARGWPPGKVRENTEAEAVGVVAHEAREHPAAFEVDTTNVSPDEVAGTVQEALADPTRRQPPGTLDWIVEDPGWFGAPDG